MSFISSAIISLLEKELATQTPEIEAYTLDLLSNVANDIVAFVEKKISGTDAVTTNTGAQNG
jgi:hypothetical protein